MERTSLIHLLNKMSISKLANLFVKSFKDYRKNLVLIVPSALLFILIILLSKLSVKINYKLQDTLSLTIWTIIFSLVMLVIISYFFSGLIGMSFLAIKNRVNMKSFFKYSNKFVLKNFLIILAILLVLNLIRYLAHNVSFFVGKFLELDVNIASGIFFLLYFGSIIGILIFLGFSSAYLITENTKIVVSIKKSIGLVKKNYIEALIILIMLFIINQFFNLYISKILTEVVNALFIVPYLSLILTRFVFEFGKR